MSESIRVFVVLGVVSLAVGCGASEPEPVADPEPIMAEPTMGKL